MKINVSDRKDEYWTDFAFFNYEDSFGTLGYNVSGKIATVDYKEGQPVVDEFVGTTEENITRTEDGGPYTFGWKEMDLEEPVKITEDEYWVLAKVEDWGENNFWIGKGDHNDGSSSWWTYSNEDPTDPDAWQQLGTGLFGGSWMVEGQISDYYYGPQYEDSVFNETQPVEGMVENYGNKDETNVTVNATITSEETGDQVYTDETLVNINKGEQELAKFQDWIPPEIGYYTINMTTNLTTDENQTNDYLEKTIYVAEIDLDLKADSIDSPNEPLYQYENKTIKGSIKNVGNYRTNTSVEMKIQRVNESDMITENFTNGLPSDWSVENLDGTGDTWSDEYGEYMKVVPENDTQNDILWTNEIDASHVTHRMPLRFYSEYEGNSSRQLVISTDGGDTVQTVKSDIGEGYIEYDLSKWTSEESSVMIGWEFFSETAEEGEYWLIDDVDVNGESLHEPAYVDENISDQVYPRMTTQVQFDDWKPDPQNLSSDYVFTMKTLHPDDNDPTNNVTTKRMFIEYNLPPNKPKNPQPANESTGISHLPEFSVNVTDPNVYVQELDVTFHLLNETGVELQNMTVTNVLPGNRASVVFSDYLEAGKTYNWYVEVEDFKESNISETWTFETYEVQPMWKTASAEIDADPPEPVENLTVEWNAGIWDADANLITWDSSYDDGSGENDTDYYNLYRSDSTEGPWDESTRIARINADKSDEYTYLDEGKAYDDTQWHYVVRGVDKLDNVDLNEQYASEKPVPTATNPNPEDGAEVEGLQQTISTDVTTPTGEPLTVKFYYGENRQLISEHTGITNETVETDYGNLTEEQMGKDHYWFVTVSYEDYNVGDIVPDNVKRGPTDEQWVYKYDAEHRASAEDALGLNSEDVWWGAMTIDLSERAGGLITQVAYYDYEAGASYAQAHVAKDDGGAPGEWLASSDEYTPSGAGWTELELNSNVVIEEDTEYWIVIELEDYGTGNYPFGTISPAVEDAGLINYNDLRNPSDWDSMDNLGFDYSWCLEALVAPKPEPEGYSFYLQDTVGPVADAGDNFTDYQGETVTLDGSASSDNVEVVNWTWNIENPKSEQTVKYGEKVGYTLEYAGDYEVELTVSDEAGHSATDTITITSLDTEKPTAKPGAPGQTRAGETYNLDGSASTDNVGIVNYTWDIKGVSGMAEQESYMDTVNGEDIDYEFPYTGAYDITLTVTDAEGNYDTEKTSVVVDPSASTFEITSPSDGASIEKKQVEVQWTDHSDMKDITYETRLDYGGWQDVGTDTSHTFIGLQDGEHIAQIRATDSIGNTYTKSVTFNIDVTKPDFQITNPSNGIEQLTYDEELVIKGTTDPDVQVWINGNEVQVTSEGTFEYEATLEKGQNVFRVTSEDDQGDTRTKNIYALYLPDLDSYVTEDDLTSTLSDYLNETEINDVLTDYVTEGELSDSLRDYMTEDEINDLLTSYLDDYVTKDNLTETLDPYLTESQINDMISDFITNGDLNDALNDYLTESEINTVLDDYITQADLTETLNPYLTESEINDLMTDYVTNGDLTDTLKDYLTEDEFNEVESEIKGTQSDISSNQDDQDDDISMNMILGIVGIILAIIALILGAWSVMNKGGKTETQEQPSQYTEESQEEELEDEDFFSEEELEE
ncbi:MAG: PKD domain-containing protein [Thermoplasmata archaeon]